MVPIHRILCPTDFSPFSRRAFQHAIRLAQWARCEVVALHVHEAAHAHAGRAGGNGGGAAHALESDHGIERLQSFVEPARASGVSVRTVLGEGADAEEILHQVRSQAADLVVMGTHRRGGLERLMLGSVAEQVLRKAECPVIIVPPSPADPGETGEEEEEEAPAPGAVPYRQILCPTDFSEASLAALRHAVDLARDAGARLTILHALEIPPEQVSGRKRNRSASELRLQRMQDAVERLAGVVPPPDGAAAFDAVILGGKAHARIVALASDLAADLIVMGVRGHAAADHALFGSTAQHVMRAADCPVLTLHAD